MRLASQPKEKSTEITVGGSTVKVFFSLPTYLQKINFFGGEPARRIALALELVSGWEGVEDEEGKPVKFDRRKFESACVQHDAFCQGCIDFGYSLYSLSEEDQKQKDERGKD